MPDRDIPDRTVLVVVGLLVLLSPAVILLLTLEFLVLSGDLVLGRVTVLELLELYLLDLSVLAAFAYLVYRLLRRAFPHGLSALRERAEGADREG